MQADTVKLEEVAGLAALWPLINDPTTPAYAKQALIGQLNSPEAERQRLDAQVKRAPPGPRAGLEADQIVARLKAMVEDLSTALEGEERDAIFARDTLRSMVDTITLTPDLTTTGHRGSGTFTHVRVNIDISWEPWPHPVMRRR